MPSALINARILEKSSQMKGLLTQHDSMHPHLRNAIEKSSQMKNFVTQHNSMPPTLTSAHTENPHK